MSITSTPYISRQTSLTGHIIQLCRFLRTKGYKISSREEQDVMNAFQIILPTSEHKYWTILRAILSKNKIQFESFEDNYKDFIFQLKKAIDSKTKDVLAESTTPQKTKPPSFESLKNWLYNKPSEEDMHISSYSNIEVLTKKDFSQLDEEEMALILSVLQKMTQKILRRKSRLRKISKSKKKTDIRMTLRHNLRSGTEINKVLFSQPKSKRLKLVLMCDVSRSMDLYSRFFIQMIYAFQTAYDRIETFVFSTVLHQVTEMLENQDYNKAFDIISERIPQWSGGTKIGACLHSFCDDHAYHMLDKKTIVLILSDGWDTGSSEVMEKSMRQIKKSCRRIIWLNPLAGHPDFEPEVIGLKSILPHIHQLHAAHNLESLKKVLHGL